MNYQERFIKNNIFKISHMGEPKWEVQHQLEEGVSEEAIFNAEDENGIAVPEDLKKLWQYTGGGVLYKNTSPPLWGWRLISTQRYLENQHKWRRKFFDEWRASYVAVFELLDPASVVVWDSSYKKIYYLDTSSGSMQAVEIADSVDDFLNKLHQSDGGIYWQWN